jgi:hypothetical protein
MSYTASGRRPLDCDFGFDFTSRGYGSFSDRPEISSHAPDWDALPESARETVALALLNEKIGGFHGRAPRELKSPAAESWLAASEKRNRR